MCRELKHKCYCGIEYPCNAPNWLCPTINGDEDSHVCPVCLDKFAEEYQAYWDAESEIENE